MADAGAWGIRLFLWGAFQGFVLMAAAALFAGSSWMQPRVGQVSSYSAEVVVPWYGYVLEGLALLAFFLLVAGTALMVAAPAPAPVVEPVAARSGRSHERPRARARGRARPQRGSG